MAPAALTGSQHAPFLEGLDRGADAAAALFGGYQDRLYDIGGLGVRLRLAGPPALERLADALSHLVVSPTSLHSLTVRIWDSSCSGVPEPDGPWHASTRGGQPVRGRGADGQSFFQWRDGSLSVLDRPHQEAYYWVRDAERDAWPERAAPLSPILGACLIERDVMLVHAGAVGTERGCVLLVGGAGAGKSHAALCAVQYGLGYIGDDTCLLAADDAPTARSIYSSAQAESATLECLPSLRPMVGNPRRCAGEKALLFLNEHVPDALIREAPLRAIAITSVADRRDTHVCPASPAEVLVALAPSSLLQLPGAGQVTLERLAHIAGGVPAFHLAAGADPSGLAAAIEAML